MSYNYKSPFHWEFIEARGYGHQYRVADADDTMVTDFGTEVEAEEYVKQQNARRV